MPILPEIALNMVEDVPVGTILPFDPENVHEDFLPLDGREIYAGKHDELIANLDHAWKYVGVHFEKWGGHITATGYRLPAPGPEDSQIILHGVVLTNFPAVTLAIRYRRTVRDDGATS